MSQLRAFDLALALDERGGTLVVGGGNGGPRRLITEPDGAYPLLPSDMPLHICRITVRHKVVPDSAMLHDSTVAAPSTRR